MTTVMVRCIHCHSIDVNKHGFQQSKQRYRCQQSTCHRTFILDYKNRGCLAAVKAQIVDMCINGSGIRDTARVLKVSRNTIINTIKKSLQFGQNELAVPAER